MPNAVAQVPPSRTFIFNRAAEAFAATYRGAPCSAIYQPDQANTLTKEDVPPKGLRIGGRPLILTCRRCNSTYGHAVDVHMQREQDVHDFFQGLPLRRTVRATVVMDEACMPINLSAMEKGFQMIGVKEATPPGVAAKQMAFMIRIRTPDAPEKREFNVQFAPYNPQRAGVGWLRAAYLVAFAKLGYRYAYHPALAVVREQIARYDEKVLPGFRCILSKPVEPALQMMVIEKLSALDGIAVIMRRHVVLLPHANDAGMHFYERAKAEGARDPQMQVSGRPIPWPTGPEFLWDFAARRRSDNQAAQ